MMKRAFNTYSIRKEWDDLGEQALQSVVDICHDSEIDRIEFLDRHFQQDELKANVKFFEDNSLKVFSIGPHVKLLAKDSEVAQMVTEGREWLTLAADCGIGYVRFQVGDGPMPRCFLPMDDFDEEDWEDYNETVEAAIAHTAKIVDPLLEAAESAGVVIAIETHHSYSSNYVYQGLLNKRYPSEKLAWIFDIGNYENDAMRWKSLEAIKARTVYWHAKAYTFDEQGLEKTLDFPKAAKICKEAGFDGELSIEFEGKMNGFLGALKTNELLKYSIAHAEGRAYAMKTDFPAAEELMKKYTH